MEYSPSAERKPEFQYGIQGNDRPEKRNGGPAAALWELAGRCGWDHRSFPQPSFRIGSGGFPKGADHPGFREPRYQPAGNVDGPDGFPVSPGLQPTGGTFPSGDRDPGRGGRYFHYLDQQCGGQPALWQCPAASDRGSLCLAGEGNCPDGRRRTFLCAAPPAGPRSGRDGKRTKGPAVRRSELDGSPKSPGRPAPGGTGWLRPGSSALGSSRFRQSQRKHGCGWNERKFDREWHLHQSVPDFPGL